MEQEPLVKEIIAMPSRNRDTLKKLFEDGAMPSAAMFADLIDSMLNMDDEGFSKSDEHGFEITNIGDSESLISFFKKSRPSEPLWSIKFDGSDNNLIFGKVSAKDNDLFNKKDAQIAKYLLNLNTSNGQAKIGIGLEQPQDTLHVAGNVRSEGRRGTVSKVNNVYPSPKADNVWHTIAGPFVGCQTLEVVARAKNDRKKRYGMVHAIAMHTISPVKKNLLSFLGLKNRIRCTHSFYDSFLHKIKLRWKPGKKKGQYELQIKTNCDYGDGSIIDYHITNLWSDQDPFSGHEAGSEQGTGHKK